jgi:(p)ppGpp synthase/HD superfamily hydrolase
MNIDQVTKLASYYHKEQYRKGPMCLPYLTHPAGVAMIVKEMGGSDHAIKVAWLHDIIEDTWMNIHMLRDFVGTEIANDVLSLTNDGELTQAHRKANEEMNAKSLSPDAALVRLADKQHNCESLILDKPDDWDHTRVMKYLTWAMSVADNCHAAGAEYPSSISKVKNKIVDVYEELNA